MAKDILYRHAEIRREPCSLIQAHFHPARQQSRDPAVVNAEKLSHFALTELLGAELLFEPIAVKHKNNVADFASCILCNK